MNKIIKKWSLIPCEARRGAPSREVYNLVAREAPVLHTNIARVVHNNSQHFCRNNLSFSCFSLCSDLISDLLGTV